MYQLFGIPNCDTVKKARTWLDTHGVEYKFFDFKKETPTSEMIKRWETFFEELPVNKKGPTFRKIKDEYESANKLGKVKLLLANLSAIKRPILEKKNKTLAIGFKPEEYDSLF